MLLEKLLRQLVSLCDMQTVAVEPSGEIRRVQNGSYGCHNDVGVVCRNCHRAVCPLACELSACGGSSRIGVRLPSGSGATLVGPILDPETVDRGMKVLQIHARSAMSIMWNHDNDRRRYNIPKTAMKSALALPESPERQKRRNPLEALPPQFWRKSATSGYVGQGLRYAFFGERSFESG